MIQRRIFIMTIFNYELVLYRRVTPHHSGLGVFIHIFIYNTYSSFYHLVHVIRTPGTCCWNMLLEHTETVVSNTRRWCADRASAPAALRWGSGVFEQQVLACSNIVLWVFEQRVLVGCSSSMFWLLE